MLWLRADKGVTGAPVTAWADQSAAADANRNATAAGALRPTFNPSNAAFNGQPTIDFSAAMQLVTGVWSVAPTQPFTYFIVAKDNTAGTGNIYFCDSISGGQCALISASGQTEWLCGGAFGGGGHATLAACVQIAIFGATPNDAFNQKTLQASTSPGAGSFTGMSIGNYQGGGAPFAGTSIAELAVYQGAISPGDAAKLETYAGARYGIAIGA